MIIDINAYLGHFAFRQLRHNTADGLLRADGRQGHRPGRRLQRRGDHLSQRAVGQRGAGRRECKPHRDRLIPLGGDQPVLCGWQDDLQICRPTSSA